MALRSVDGLDWQLDTASREIVRDGRRIRLAEKPFRVLEALVDARGEVVTRTALRKMLWTDDTFVDFDNNLNSAVATLRHVLARPESTSRHIETIPKVGYRLIVKAEEPVSSVEKATVDTVPSGSPVHSSRVPVGMLIAAIPVAAIVAFVVGADLWRRPTAQMSAGTTVHRAARDSFDRGKHLRSRFLVSPEAPPTTLLDARMAFADALRLDPAFAEAAAEEADTLVDMSFAGAVKFRDGLVQAREAARRALRLDPGQPIASRVMGMTALVLDWDFRGARGWLDRNPSGSSDARTSLARATWMAAAGRFDEAVRAAERAVALDPADYYLRADLAMFYLAAGQDARAAESSHGILQDAPEFRPAHTYALIAHERLGQWTEAARHAHAIMKTSAGSAQETVPFDAGAGRHAVTRWRQLELARLERQAEGRRAEFALQLALQHAALGDRDAALNELEAALTRRDALLVFIRMYPELAGLRNEPAFQRIAEAIGPQSPGT